LQCHAHEAVHYVVAGTGYSEIGGRRCHWKEGDFIYTPPWVFHRHYNTGPSPARLIIVENSKLLEALGLHERESMGLIDYASYLQRNPRREKQRETADFGLDAADAALLWSHQGAVVKDWWDYYQLRVM